MKPHRSILDASFRYVPSVSTSVSDTWRRFGWRPADIDRRLGTMRVLPASSRETATRVERRSE